MDKGRLMNKILIFLQVTGKVIVASIIFKQYAFYYNMRP